MFRRHYEKRSPNILFVIFRLILSMVMFVVLLAGIYTAYKHFSGFDPLKLDPRSAFSGLLGDKVLLVQSLSNQINQKVLGQKSTVKVSSNSSDPAKNVTSDPVLRFLLLADSHNNNTNLEKAINQAKANFPELKFIIGLGDYSDVGTIMELKKAKTELDNSGLRYFLVAGDHDLWDSRNKQLPSGTNFNQIFGPVYQSFTYDDFLFLLLDNSDDYKGLGETELKWIETELEKAKENPPKGIFVFLHEPLFHPSSDHVMGKTESGLRQQARDLMFQLKSAGVKKVFAGDIHFFSEYSEPVTNLPMVTIGAVTIERNPQAPRFGVVTVFDDGSTKVEDIEIK